VVLPGEPLKKAVFNRKLGFLVFSVVLVVLVVLGRCSGLKVPCAPK